MGKCPFCAEEIDDDAVKCGFCGKSLYEKDSPSHKWYFMTRTWVVGFLCVGPLILPLVWVNPHIKKKKKIIITVSILVLTGLLAVISVMSIIYMSNYYKQTTVLLK